MNIIIRTALLAEIPVYLKDAKWIEIDELERNSEMINEIIDHYEDNEDI